MMVNELLAKARRVMAAEKAKEANGGKSVKGEKKVRKRLMANNSGFGATGMSMSQANRTGFTEMADDPAIAARRIGPFSFEVDQMIDTEVLSEMVVRDDLKELNQILDQGETNLGTKFFGKSKRKK